MKKLLTIALVVSVWAGSALAMFDNFDHTYEDPLKTRIIANGNNIRIIQGKEDHSFVIGTGKEFKGSGETVEEYDGNPTTGNQEYSWALAFFDEGIVSLDEGGASPAHKHPIGEEDYFFLRGKGIVRILKEMDKLPEADQSSLAVFNEKATSVEVSPKSYVNVPIHTGHSVQNTGKGQLVLAVKCTPCWKLENFILLK